MQSHLVALSTSGAFSLLKLQPDCLKRLTRSRYQRSLTVQRVTCATWPKWSGCDRDGGGHAKKLSQKFLQSHWEVLGKEGSSEKKWVETGLRSCPFFLLYFWVPRYRIERNCPQTWNCIKWWTFVIFLSKDKIVDGTIEPKKRMWWWWTKRKKRLENQDFRECQHTLPVQCCLHCNFHGIPERLIDVVMFPFFP